MVQHLPQNGMRNAVFYRRLLPQASGTRGSTTVLYHSLEANRWEAAAKLNCLVSPNRITKSPPNRTLKLAENRQKQNRFHLRAVTTEKGRV